MSLATSEGNPKIPLPMIELMTSAARLHRPMARTRPDFSPPGKTWFYHSFQLSAITFQQRPVMGASVPLGRQRHGRLRTGSVVKDPDRKKR
jgi:hypothetical protein